MRTRLGRGLGQYGAPPAKTKTGFLAKALIALTLFSTALVGFGGSSTVAADSGSCMGFIYETTDAAKESFKNECGRKWDDQIRDQCTWVSSPGQGWVCHEYAPNGVSNPRLPGSDGSGYGAGTTERKSVKSTNAASYWTKSRMLAAKDADEGGSTARIQPPPVPETGRGIPSTYRKRTGRLFFTTAAGNSKCTASVVDTPGGNVIWTAGHCLHQDGEWRTNVAFMPGYDAGDTPYGKWEATALYSLTHWTEYNFLSSDLGVVVLETKGGQSITDVVGGNPILFRQPAGTPIYGVAYEIRQDRQVDCSGTFTVAGELPGMYRYFCEDFTGGSSGGGLFTTASNGAPALVGIHTNRWAPSGISYSPYFADQAELLYQATKDK